jgi:uncharacterized membrane protein SpoIIM required for sporulation
MLELLINPKRAERKPSQMFFIGFIYAIIAVLVSLALFSTDYVQAKYMSWITILLLVIVTLPYFYYTIKLEEKKDRVIEGEFKMLREHGKAIAAFLWLFLGFLLAFALAYIILPQFVPASSNLYKAQIETFCQINRPNNFNDCLSQYGLSSSITGKATSDLALDLNRAVSIFMNNLKVLLLTLVTSLIFGAGAIFILAWNASVIAAAIKIFTSSDTSIISKVGLGLGRYMIHGIPEIMAYFVGALAGGILSIAIIRREFNTEKFLDILQDALSLFLIAIGILIISALIEVFITPKLF